MTMNEFMSSTTDADFAAYLRSTRSTTQADMDKEESTHRSEHYTPAERSFYSEA